MTKYAMITGGTAGIGLATAMTLGRAGYHIVLNGILEDQGKEAVAALKAEGIASDLFIFDVTDENAVTAAFAQIKAKFPKLDVLVNNAGGLGGRSRFEDMETGFFRKVMALNLDSVFFVSRAAIPLLKAAGGASIINFSSNAGWNAGGRGPVSTAPPKRR